MNHVRDAVPYVFLTYVPYCVYVSNRANYAADNRDSRWVHSASSQLVPEKLAMDIY